MKKYIFFILTIFVLSCNQNQLKIVDGIDKDDKIYETTSDDVEMNIASKKAVDSIAIFDAAFKSKSKNISFISLKKRFKIEGGSENIWISPINKTEKGYLGTVDNDPIYVKDVKYGDTVLVKANEVSDWMYVENNLLHGGYTLRVAIKHMNPKEKEEFLKSLDYKIE